MIALKTNIYFYFVIILMNFGIIIYTLMVLFPTDFADIRRFLTCITKTEIQIITPYRFKFRNHFLIFRSRVYGSPKDKIRTKFLQIYN